MRKRFREMFLPTSLEWEFVLAGSWKITGLLLAIAFASWILLTEYFCGILLGFWHEEFEYGFLLPPALSVYLLACVLSRGIVRAREGSFRLPLPKESQYPPAMWAAMCERIARTKHNSWLVRIFYSWLKKRLTKANAKQPLRLSQLPTVWRRPWAVYAARMGVLPGTMIILATPAQFWIGNALADALDGLSSQQAYISGGEVCDQQIVGHCTEMAREDSGGGLVVLKANAPPEGLLRFYLRNWPRSGRTLHLESKPMRAQAVHVRSDSVTIKARGRMVEIAYHLSRGDPWSLWAELEYRKWNCDLLQAATYEGFGE